MHRSLKDFAKDAHSTPEELRTRREALGLKQTELAQRAGISQSMVARIEAGNVDPRSARSTRSSSC